MLQGISITQAFIDALAGLVLNVAAIALSIGITAYVSKRRWHARVQRLFKVNRLTNSAIRLRLSRIQVIAKGTMGVIPTQFVSRSSRQLQDRVNPRQGLLVSHDFLAGQQSLQAITNPSDLRRVRGGDAIQMWRNCGDGP